MENISIVYFKFRPDIKAAFDVDNKKLFSDRTVKVWNLVTCQEIMTLSGHPNNVNVSLIIFVLDLFHIFYFNLDSTLQISFMYKATYEFPINMSFRGNYLRGQSSSLKYRS